ncbi:uncharacterized protein [Rhodnius prolixus]|uniref:uncharacterized protein n=1 Tax=Rhodnius prolixus TaxID=13249 RepID=UPI003D18EABA
MCAGVTPIDLLAQARRLIYLQKDALGKCVAKAQAREYVKRAWRERWLADTRGRWTASLIGDPAAWADRRHGEIDYYLTQFLTGHGYFSSYLGKMGNVATQNCIFGDSAYDYAHHSFLECERWAEERAKLQARTGPLSPHNIVATKLVSPDLWEEVSY